MLESNPDSKSLYQTPASWKGEFLPGVSPSTESSSSSSYFKIQRSFSVFSGVSATQTTRAISNMAANTQFEKTPAIRTDHHHLHLQWSLQSDTTPSNTSIITSPHHLHFTITFIPHTIIYGRLHSREHCVAVYSRTVEKGRNIRGLLASACLGLCCDRVLLL